MSDIAHEDIPGRGWFTTLAYPVAIAFGAQAAHSRLT
jgi:hypothetical protein